LANKRKAIVQGEGSAHRKRSLWPGVWHVRKTLIPRRTCKPKRTRLGVSVCQGNRAVYGEHRALRGGTRGADCLLFSEDSSNEGLKPKSSTKPSSASRSPFKKGEADLTQRSSIKTACPPKTQRSRPAKSRGQRHPSAKRDSGTPTRHLRDIRCSRGKTAAPLADSA